MISLFKSILKEVINSDSKPSAQAKEPESNNDFSKLLFDLYYVMKGDKTMDWSRIKWQYEQGFLSDLEFESLKEKENECRKRKPNCYDCPYKEDCVYEAVLNSLDQW